MKKTTFLLIGAALVVIAVMALVAASEARHDTPAPLPQPAPPQETTAAPAELPPVEPTEDTSQRSSQYLPDTGGIKLPAKLAHLLQ